MSNNGQTPISPADDADVGSVPRPVVALATDYGADHFIPCHSHRRAQLVHAATGVMTVTTNEGAWLIPRGLAVWLPAGVAHGIRTQGPLAMRTLYMAPCSDPDIPSHCRVIAVSPLLRELILAAMDMPRLYDEDGPHGRRIAVLMDELKAAPPAPLHLPLPRDGRLRHVTDSLLARPGDRRSLRAWSRTAGASPRTLARLFLRETGMTFEHWRRQARLQDALRRLAAGQSVTAVAFTLGYGNTSAFITMFRRALGATPGRYFVP